MDDCGGGGVITFVCWMEIMTGTISEMKRRERGYE